MGAGYLRDGHPGEGNSSVPVGCQEFLVVFSQVANDRFQCHVSFPQAFFCTIHYSLDGAVHTVRWEFRQDHWSQVWSLRLWNAHEMVETPRPRAQLLLRW